MPGAPNRPPETAAAPPAPPVVVDPPERRVLRRLVPSHVALLLDSWKGPLGPELTGPFEKAEGAFSQGDFAGATSALDLLSIRFAEPRWPSLPEPFRKLRVPIPAPMPPSWDPEHALPAPEREGRKARRAAEEQLELVAGALGWASAHSIDAAELAGLLAEARATLGPDGVPEGFYAKIDAIWAGLRPRLPRPKSVARPVASAAAAAEPEEA